MAKRKVHWYECCTRARNSPEPAKKISDVTCKDCLKVIKTKKLKDPSCFTNDPVEIVGIRKRDEIIFCCPICGQIHSCSDYGPRSGCHVKNAIIVENTGSND